MEYLISQEELEKLKKFLMGRGISLREFYSKGTTSLVFIGHVNGKKAIIKLERADSPRKNFKREAEILKFLEREEITPRLVDYGVFEGREFLVREFAEGEPLLYATPQKKHILEILEKTYKLDVLGVDHGQIQGGKHILIGDAVWIIDFEKAGFRKPKNVTSAMAMIFLNDNIISKRVREEFQLDQDFLNSLREALREYKTTKNIEKLRELLSAL
ncbi:serine/threonine protein kinase [Thermococcus sp. 101 C5]|uniref:serine/threonine protein kinase n=1 Tax=Thermococcus sp. 101 C5 TaxID=2654197 RepID=UPI00128DA54B|nr:serine/threonine protein kinase [Thermococcus sp. 101 C5]MPW38965.1 serine/threonine protein kinase [Thermococcus sp. 101 C5]